MAQQYITTSRGERLLAIAPQHHPDNPLLGQSRITAIEAGKLFLGDAGLVHGRVTIESSHTPPAPRGEYSLRIITDETPSTIFDNVRVVAEICMEQRTAEAIYIDLIAQGYKPEEILLIGIAGGPIQEFPERKSALIAQLDYAINASPNLERVVLAPHTSDLTRADSSPCGGIKHQLGGVHLADAVDPSHHESLRSAHDTDNIELAATQEVLAVTTHEMQTRYSGRNIIFDAMIYVPNEEKDHPTGIAAVHSVDAHPYLRRLSDLITPTY